MSRLQRFIDSEFVIASVMFLMPVSAGAILLGVVEGVEKYNKGGCTYETIIDYFPVRAATCELIRKRWAK